MRLTYHPDAKAELIEAARFYNQRVSGLGAEFLEAVDQSGQIILKTPDRWRVVDGNVRRYLMSRFPYTIYYRLLPDRIRILAFAHHGRHPSYWLNRRSD